MLTRITLGVAVVVLDAGGHAHGADWTSEKPVATEPSLFSPAARTPSKANLSWPGSSCAASATSAATFKDQWPDKIFAGRMEFSATEISLTAEGFTFRPCNDYANVAFKATRVSSRPNNNKPGDGDATKQYLDAQAFSMDKLPKMTGEKQRLKLCAEISEVKEEGAAFTAVFTFACEDVTCKVERTEYKVTHNPVPDIREMRYGPHFRQTIDFYKAKSDKPTPLVVSIHGGGWTGASKAQMLPPVTALLSRGISVASIGYRLIYDGRTDKVHPELAAPMLDAARALQFLRSKAGELNIDKERIAATGISAGANSSLWLALHQDLADPSSPDPVARESTRVCCAGCGGFTYASYDPKQLDEWVRNHCVARDTFTYSSIASILGVETQSKDDEAIFMELLEQRKDLLPWLREFSLFEMVTRDAPPVYFSYGASPMNTSDHSPQWGYQFKLRMDEVGAECHFICKGIRDADYPDMPAFLIKKLKEPAHPAGTP